MKIVTRMTSIIVSTLLTLPNFSYAEAARQNEMDAAYIAGDRQSQEDIVRLVAASIHAWNPSVESLTIESILQTHIETSGFQVGLLGPLLSMIDMSYATGRPGFANVLNPLIGKIAPGMARELGQRLNISTSYAQEIDSIAKNPIRDIENKYKGALGKWEPEKGFTGDPRENKSGKNIDQILMGPGSIFSYSRENQISRHQRRFDPTKGGINSNPGQRNEDYDGSRGMPSQRGERLSPSRGKRSEESSGHRFRGPLTNKDIMSYNACMVQCAEDAGTLASTFGTAGLTLGTYLSPTLGPLGPVTGGALGVAAGVALGGYKCAHSTQCSLAKDEKEKKGTEPGRTSPDKDRREPREPKSPIAKDQPKEKQPPKDDSTGDSTPKKQEPVNDGSNGKEKKEKKEEKQPSEKKQKEEEKKPAEKKQKEKKEDTDKDKKGDKDKKEDKDDKDGKESGIFIGKDPDFGRPKMGLEQIKFVPPNHDIRINPIPHSMRGF